MSFSAYGHQFPGRALPFLVSLENVFPVVSKSARPASSKLAMGELHSEKHTPCDMSGRSNRDFRTNDNGKWLVINKRLWNWSC